MTTTDTDALTERIRDEVYGTWVSSCCDGAVVNIDEAAEIAADLAPIVAAEVRKAKAEAWDEAASHAESKPWITNFRADDLRTANPYRETGGSDDRR